MTTDVIDIAAGIEPGSALDQLRGQRSDIRKHAQGSHEALFAPADDAGLTLAERYAVALHIARSDGAEALAAFYRDRLVAIAGRDLLSDLDAGSQADTRLARLIDHAELLTSRPVEAAREHLRRLTEAGLSTRAIVVLSQLVGFVSFQTRLAAGLRLLGAAR